ncbi:MAG: zinc-ribbon domain-containing protein [Lachnospiraceae bacterium]|nr:zinc-ribbon domain-containing protein [Lachnospiraceae bacterium]
MNCKHCGAPLKDGSRFCPKCGKPVDEKPQKSQPSSGQNQKDLNQGTDRKQAPKKKKGPVAAILICFMVLLLLLVLAVAGFVGYRVISGGLGSKESQTLSRQDPDEDGEEKQLREEDGDEEPEEETEETTEAETEKETEEETEEETTAPPETSEAADETGIHRYELVVEDCTWNQAYNKAKEAGGYLVHINTQEEYDFLLTQVLGSEEAKNLKIWIGGARAAGSYEYHWANEDGTFGEDTLNMGGYAGYWMVNEPSFRDESIGQDEYYMNIFYYSKENRWVWNDVPDDLIGAVSSYQGSIAYIIEFD